MLLHMLVQVGNAGKCVATVLTVCPPLMGLLMVDQGSFAAVSILASWADMCHLLCPLLVLVVPVVA